MPMLVVGIDIGVTGAIAAISRSGLQGVHDMPAAARGKGDAAVRTEVNPAGLADLMRDIMKAGPFDPEDVLAVFERVSAMPKQGAASNFSLGDSSACVRSVMATLRIPAQLITAQQWKKHFNIVAHGPERKKKGERFTDAQEKERARARAIAKAEAKERARAMVIQLYPGISSSLARKADHNRAEAVLIARFGHERLT